MFLSRLNWPVDAAGTSKRKERNDRPAVLRCKERISDKLAELILLLLWGGEEKIETVETVDGFAFSLGLDGALAGSHRLDRRDESRKHGGFGYRDIVRAQHEF